MKLAAIDIGSNAIRLQITRVIDYEHQITFKKLEYVRFPLRLGQDVFTTSRISKPNETRFMKLMQAYKNLIDLYEIRHYYGCATSAIREAENGHELVERVKNELDLKIHVISGEREAEMINRVIGINLDEKPYLHIDVGGGSTELNLYVGRQKILSKSFKIGSVRRLGHRDSPKVWASLRKWVSEHLKKEYGKVTAIGTGGNINKLYELAHIKSKRRMSMETVLKVQGFLKEMTIAERMARLQLNPDRADVIVPASEIYIEVMKAAKAKSIVVPDVGLKDGINFYLYEKHYPNKGRVFVKN